MYKSTSIPTYIEWHGNSAHISKEKRDKIRAYNHEIKIEACKDIANDEENLHEACKKWQIPISTLWYFIHMKLKDENPSLYRKTVNMLMRRSNWKEIRDKVEEEFI